MKTKVLFLCTENSCRTLMAEAFLRELAGDVLEIVSAGSEAGHLDLESVAAMREVGIHISSARTKSVNPYLGERFNYVITLCNRQIERLCPIFPGALWRQTWELEIPAALSSIRLKTRRACSGFSLAIGLRRNSRRIFAYSVFPRLRLASPKRVRNASRNTR